MLAFKRGAVKFVQSLAEGRDEFFLLRSIIFCVFIAAQHMKGLTMIKIEKNIPMPSLSSKYPFADMQVGDSVFFDNEPAGSQSKPVIAARNFGSKNDMKFLSRSEGAGVRVWRVK